MSTQDFGTVDYSGKELKLNQQPYLDGYDDTLGYYADAEDEDGNEYRVRWQIVNLNSEQEEDACDWDVYTVWSQNE